MKNSTNPIKPFDSGNLKVSKIHKIYYQQCGNPKGIPAIYIYGGPGGMLKDKHTRYFDLEKFRVIQYEQRGCGKAEPQGEIKDNTTEDLVEDIEKLRKFLNIEKWLVIGGSWGATLALLYAEKYYNYVSGLIVRGVFTATPWELKWFPNIALKTFYPEIYDKLNKIFTKKELKYYPSNMYSKFCRLNEIEKERYIFTINQCEEILSTVLPSEQNSQVEEKITKDIINSFKIYSYYVSNYLFLNNNKIILNADKLNKIPYGVIINGRYDIICPIKTAYKLSKKWTRAKLIIIEGVGHHSSEVGVDEAMIKAIDEYPEK